MNELIEKLLEEFIDLLPRMSDDDPVAPALADTVRRAKEIREALAKQDSAQPVGHVLPFYGNDGTQKMVQFYGDELPANTKLYLAPASAPATEWQPIETAPKDGTQVLLVNANAHDKLTYVGHFSTGTLNNPQSWEKAWRANCCGRFSSPTHWMPLPEPPLPRGTNEGEVR